MISLLRPSGNLNRNMSLIFIIRCKYSKKVIVFGNISCHSTLGRYIHRVYIALNTISAIQGIFQILQIVLPSYSLSILYSNFRSDSRGNSYCKKDYSKGEVNIAKITQRRSQKMKKNVAMASFYCLVGAWSYNTVKFGEKIVFYLFIKRKQYV